MKHLVQFSTGLSSAEVAWRLTGKYGKDAVVLMTADTLREDPDNWRFAHEVAARLGCEWIKLTDGRTPMQAGRDAKCVPNDRMALCSQLLKREPLRWFMDTFYDPGTDVAYIGYDWSEQTRIAGAQKFWAPWKMIPLLAEPPYAPPLEDLFRSRGIEPPLLYKYNYGHANCGGCCVRGGQASWAKTLQVFPERYQEWEREEEQSRRELDKDVAILRDRSNAAMTRNGGKLVPLTLRAYRERLQENPTLFDADDHGVCACDMYLDDEPAPELEPRQPKAEKWDGVQWAEIPMQFVSSRPRRTGGEAA